jgi:hypothetical protein
MNIKLFIVSIFCLFASAVFSQTETLSVKNRWNIKLGYSSYKITTVYYDNFRVMVGLDSERFARTPNVRAEVNYGVAKWLEIGGYLGFTIGKYSHWDDYTEAEQLSHISFRDVPPRTTAYPTFGINVNFQLLPLFVKNPNCKWDFYALVRYGGCYLIKWGNEKRLVPDANPGTWDDVTPNGDGTTIDFNKKYRHEYGAGIGGAYYIKNIIGFYMEAMGGQFSYYPELVRSPYAIRVGLTAKF